MLMSNNLSVRGHDNNTITSGTYLTVFIRCSFSQRIACRHRESRVVRAGHIYYCSLQLNGGRPRLEAVIHREIRSWNYTTNQPSRRSVQPPFNQILSTVATF